MGFKCASFRVVISTIYFWTGLHCACSQHIPVRIVILEKWSDKMSDEHEVGWTWCGLVEVIIGVGKKVVLHSTPIGVANLKGISSLSSGGMYLFLGRLCLGLLVGILLVFCRLIEVNWVENWVKSA